MYFAPLPRVSAGRGRSMRPPNDRRLLRSRGRILCGLLLVLLVAGEGVVAARPAEKKERPETERRRRNRERWKELDRKKRQEIAKLVELLRKLPPETREKLLNRLKAMTPEERRTRIRKARGQLEAPPEVNQARRERRRLLENRLKTLSAKEREKLRQLTPAERARFLARSSQSQRRRLIERLPPPLREKARKLPPKEQVEVLRRHHAAQAAQRTFRDPRELRRIREARPQELRKLLRVPRDRPPPPGSRPTFLSEATWRRWLKLKPYERPRVLRYLRGGEARKASPQSPGRAASPSPGLSPGFEARRRRSR